MIATMFTLVTAGLLAVGVVNEVVVPAGTYVYDTGTELYQEYVVGTE
jgi:hypothetical protein